MTPETGVFVQDMALFVIALANWIYIDYELRNNLRSFYWNKCFRRHDSDGGIEGLKCLIVKISEKEDAFSPDPSSIGRLLDHLGSC